MQTPIHFTSFDEAVHYLTHELHKTNTAVLKDAEAFHKSQQLLALLDNPQNATPTVHIAATSGKGSIAYATDAILRAHGFQTTLIVSPHAYSIRERIQQNGQQISEELFLGLANELFTYLHNSAISPSYFEAMMAMGFLAAQQQHGDYVVLETGLGGLWDTSNTIERQDKLAVIGSIGLDHTHILGNTLPKIAYQKAGILYPNGRAIALRQDKSVTQTFEAVAKEKNSPITWVKPMDNPHDTNWRMAKAAAKALAERDGWEYSEQKADSAIRSLTIPARFEVRTRNGQTYVLDAAHNPQKVTALVSWLKQMFPDTSFSTVLSIGETKDAPEMVKLLNEITATFVITEFFTDQQDLPVHAYPAAKLAAIIAEHSDKPQNTVLPANQALKTATQFGNPVLVTGSFYLVGELDQHLK